MCAVASALLVVFGPVLAAEQDDGTDQNLAVVLAGAGVDPSNSALLIRRLEDDQEWASGGDRIEQRFPPASTSKIPHTLIALETGYASGPDMAFKWDGQKRFAEQWNRDQTLATAYKFSTVWVFQKITSDLGYETMAGWIDKLDYGNKNTGSVADLTSYWLRGPLETSAREQVEFLARLAQDDLPLRPATLSTGKTIMVEDSGADWTLYAKTGWRSDGINMDIGWYVGWLESTQGDSKQTFVFAFNMDMPNATDRNKRREAVRATLVAIGALPD
jgi:beta-lactamase class D